MAVSDRPPKNAFVAFARKIYNPIGFAKGYNFILWFIFSGALFGFLLARLSYLDFYGQFCYTLTGDDDTREPPPGVCFWWLQQPYTTGMIVHLAGILPASLLALVQFVPAVRHRAIMVHRVNGYIVLLLSLVGCAGIFVIAGRTFGGGMDVQFGVGALTIAFIWALVMAYINVKRLQIEQHRAWMLRAWFWACSIITLRLILIISALIPTETSYRAMPCDEVNWFMQSMNRTLSMYPECAPYYSGENIHQHAIVRATLIDPMNGAEAEARLDSNFGPALWLAWVIHVVGVEIYLHLTPREHERLRKVSYQRQLEAGMKHPGSAGLTADRLGDAEKWEPPEDTEKYQSVSSQEPAFRPS